MKRTLENCRLVQKYGHPHQYDGVCEGFARSEYDDEPCEICKRCELQYLNVEAAHRAQQEGSGQECLKG